MKLLALIFAIGIPLIVRGDELDKTQIHWHDGTKLTFELPESWRVSAIRDHSFRLSQEDAKSRAEPTPEVTFGLYPYPLGEDRASISTRHQPGDGRNSFKQITLAGSPGFMKSSTIPKDIYQNLYIVPLDGRQLIVIVRCPVESWEREARDVAGLLSTLTFADSLAKDGITLAPRPAKSIALLEQDMPYTAKHSLVEDDSLVYRLPDGKDVALWIEEDKLASGLPVPKSGLRCRWGEKAFELTHEKKVKNPDGSISIDPTSYIEPGLAITSGSKTTEHQLRIGDWDFSFTDDLQSNPKLDVRVEIRAR